MAERAGFEPAIPCGIRAFQARALGHYATSPIQGNFIKKTHLFQFLKKERFEGSARAGGRRGL